MFQASERFGAHAFAASRTTGPWLVGHQDDPRSLRLVAGIRRGLGPGARLVSVPLAEVVDRRSAGRTVVIVAPAVPGDVLGVIAQVAELVDRLVTDTADLHEAARSVDVDVILVAPRALLGHRRIRALLARTHGLAWPEDDVHAGRRPTLVDPAVARPCRPPVQVLADRVAGWGVTDAAALDRLSAALDAQLSTLTGVDAESRSVEVLTELRWAVRGLRRPERADSDPGLVAELRRLALEVRVVHTFLRTCPPGERPHFAPPDDRS